jgi:hypothetical protein
LLNVHVDTVVPLETGVLLWYSKRATICVFAHALIAVTVDV